VKFMLHPVYRKLGVFESRAVERAVPGWPCTHPPSKANRRSQEARDPLTALVQR
jgi:hypothetical protein